MDAELKELQLECFEAALAHLGEFNKRLAEDPKVYARKNSNHVVFFDCFIYTSNFLIWRGDIDYSIEKEELIRLSFKIKQKIYLFSREKVDHDDVNKVPHLGDCSFYTDGEYTYECPSEMIPFIIFDEGGVANAKL
jgi:hypothetical protein